MERTRVKICGICRPEDALAAARAGADAVGLVLHPASLRFVTAQVARDILAVLPPFVTPVGLFVDATAIEVRTTAEELGLRHVQLHGHEPPELISELGGLLVLKAVRVARETFRAELDRWRDAMVMLRLTQLRGLVLETAGAPTPGGSGITNDWTTIIHHQATGALDGLPPLIAAGGLQPETVADVVRRLRPWAVDVSSGIEDAPGRKAAAKIAEFIAAVRQADNDALNKSAH